MAADTLPGFGDLCAQVRGRLREPAAVFAGPRLRRLAALDQHPRFLVETGELLDIAALGPGVGGQVPEPLLLRPAARHREGAVRIARGDNARQDPACLVQSFLDEGRGVLAEALLKLPLPDFRGRVGIVAHAPERLEEMPVALELVIVDRKSTRLNSSHRCISYAV